MANITTFLCIFSKQYYLSNIPQQILFIFQACFHNIYVLVLIHESICQYKNLKDDGRRPKEDNTIYWQYIKLSCVASINFF
jgi:hypothetical protein